MSQLSQRGWGGPSRLACAAALLGGVAWVAGCGDGATEPPPPTPDSPRPTTVMVGPATATLTALAATVQLTAEVRDQNGRAMAGATVTWASGSAEVATVSSSGLVTAAGNGTATVTATAGSASGTAAVTVAQEVGTIAVSPALDTLVVGDTLRLAAEAFDANGHAVAGSEFTWASADTSVATVDATGLATGAGAGEAEVTATASGITGRAVLTVVDPAPAAIAVTPDTVALTALGQTAQLTALVRDQVGRVMEGVRVSWSSADTAVAAVDSAGLVTAIGSGAATVTASAGEASGGALVTVMQSAGSVVVSPAADTIAPGDTLRLAARAFDANGNAIAGAEFEWASSDESVTAVDEFGLVRGIAEGAATITAVSGNAGGTSEIAVQNPDRAALVALYEATDGPNWVNNENWLTEVPLGDWQGVDTDPSGRVVRLDLGGRWDGEARQRIRFGLQGPIPGELGKLTHLEYLSLANNELTGPIPPELGNLAKLDQLDLSDNVLTSAIPPELGRLTQLTSLRLGSSSPRDRRNVLTGPIPPELAGLANLRELFLRFGDLTGQIPAELGNLSRLFVLDLAGNRLVGGIPAELGNATGLAAMDLAGNGLTGTVPPALANLHNLDVLVVVENQLMGPLPQSFAELPRLRVFRFSNNNGLCAPGTGRFANWAEGIDFYEGAYCNEADASALAELFESAGGRGWANSDGWLGGPALAGWHGVSADSLGRVTALDLSHNRLAGRLPISLGRLAQLTALRVDGNPNLSGSLPVSLYRAGRPLDALHYRGTKLCAPVSPTFREWLSQISSHEGTGIECPEPLDRDLLVGLYEATDGANWINSDNWLTDAPLNAWHGVEVDGDGMVVALHLAENGLSGPIPVELAYLAGLEWLDLGSNSLEGPIPPALGNLANLRSLTLSYNSLSGSIPPELGNLADLEVLNLNYNNSLAGALPAELGKLGKLESLEIFGCSLGSSIPPELGDLVNLQKLALFGSDLSGPIPPELGNLINLRVLRVYGHVSGPIPPELGNLVNLELLDLKGNRLTGSLPPELGGLVNLRSLDLSGNRLTGPVPSELGGLAKLERVYLNTNRLTGPVPPEFGGLAALRELFLAANADMSGPLPRSLTGLVALESLQAGGTGLCAPSDIGFLEWLDALASRRVALCDGVTAMAYLVQAVQSREFPVPLVAGEEALLRVFVTAGRDNDDRLPPVRASFYLNGALAHVAEVAGKPGPVPTDVDESSLEKSVGAEIPAAVIRPGLEMAIEVDPDGTLDSDLGVARRIPETGRISVDVRAMPVFDLTLIPLIQADFPDSSAITTVAAMAADPESHEMLSQLRLLLPVAGLTVNAHEPVLTSTVSVSHREVRRWTEPTAITRAIRVLEDGSGHYMSVFPTDQEGLGRRTGHAEIGGQVSWSLLDPWLIAHELGHNMSLNHAPCGGAGNPDRAYPTADGTIGVWGYDFRDRRLVPPGWFDLMGYCSSSPLFPDPQPHWVSDYHFTKALHYRLANEGAPGAAAVASTTESLLLWGGADSTGTPFLEPAFVVDAPPSLPRRPGGEYGITGRAADGSELFSFRFDMPETADGDGGSSFAFALPVRDAWAGTLASVTLSGPGGSTTLDGDTDRPTAILRNPRNGQVRGILQDLPSPMRAAMRAAGSAAGPGLEILFSRGIPDAAAWRR